MLVRPSGRVTAATVSAALRPRGWRLRGSSAGAGASSLGRFLELALARSAAPPRRPLARPSWRPSRPPPPPPARAPPSDSSAPGSGTATPAAARASAGSSAAPRAAPAPPRSPNAPSPPADARVRVFTRATTPIKALDGEKKKVRCHLINCILMHAKVVVVSDPIRNNSATICSRTQNRVQVNAPSRGACPKS